MTPRSICSDCQPFSTSGLGFIVINSSYIVLLVEKLGLLTTTNGDILALLVHDHIWSGSAMALLRRHRLTVTASRNTLTLYLLNFIRWPPSQYKINCLKMSFVPPNDDHIALNSVR